jgi:hypothetical protein
MFLAGQPVLTSSPPVHKRNKDAPKVIPSAITRCKAYTARLTSLTSFLANSPGSSANVSSVNKVVSKSSIEISSSLGELDRLSGEGGAPGCGADFGFLAVGTELTLVAGTSGNPACLFRFLFCSARLPMLLNEEVCSRVQRAINA